MAGAGEDDHADRVVEAGVAKGGRELLEGACTVGVVVLRSMDGDGGDEVALGVEHFLESKARGGTGGELAHGLPPPRYYTNDTVVCKVTYKACGPGRGPDRREGGRDGAPFRGVRGRTDVRLRRTRGRRRGDRRLRGAFGGPQSPAPRRRVRPRHAVRRPGGAWRAGHRPRDRPDGADRPDRRNPRRAARPRLAVRRADPAGRPAAPHAAGGGPAGARRAGTGAW